MMSPINPTEKEILKTVLEPLLEDFRFWFSRASDLLESETLTFLAPTEQEDLLRRVREADKEVQAAQLLFKMTGGEVGVEMTALVPWHQLVAECWRVSMYWRSLKEGRPLR